MDESIKARLRRLVYEAPAPDRCPDRGPCLIFAGHIDRDGYGWFYADGTQDRAHRFAFFLAHGRWPEPCCLHHCDVRACCAEAHLFEGTRRENHADMMSKGRGSFPRGESNGRSKLSPGVALEAVRLSVSGLSERAIASRLGFGRTTIQAVLQGKTWGHVTGRMLP